MIEAARKYHVRMQVGLNNRSSRNVREAMEFLHGGGIGELIFGGRGNDAIMVGADDGKRCRLQGAVDGGDQHQAAGADHGGAGREEEIHVGDMLNDFHVEHDVEGFALGGQFLGSHRTIIDLDAALGAVGHGDLDVLFRGVGAQHACAHAGDGFG